MINILINQSRPITVGGQVSGQAIWTPNPGQKARAFKVKIHWRTEGRGSPDRKVAWEAVLPFNDQTPMGPVTMPFDMQLPADGPVTYNGHYIRIIWEVYAEVDEPMKTDEKFAVPILVIPRMISDNSGF